METGVLLFERTDLEDGIHTIRIVRASGVIDVDYLVYAIEEVPPVPVDSGTIFGDGVKVCYDADDQTLTLYRTAGNEVIQMSKPATLGYPIVNGAPVTDFSVTSCDTQSNVPTTIGTGDRMIIVSRSASTGLTRTYTMETSHDVSGAIYTSTVYQASASVVNVDWFVENEFELYNAQDRIWSYNGGGEGPMHHYDTIQKIDLTDSQTFSRENRQDYTAASIPVADIYTDNGGITIGDASAGRREVRTPVQETSNSAKVSIRWPGTTISSGKMVAAGESFINVHAGDYYGGLRGYAFSMDRIGVVMHGRSDINSSSYDLRWESWGWGYNWTIDLILGELDKLEAAGIKQITLDDGWYTSPGDWQLSPSKFPNGAADAKRLTDAIHAHGMTALLWWRPCDGGQNNSVLYQTHPEYFCKNANGTTATLGTAGSTNHSSFNAGMGYALCPLSEGAIASQVDFINRAMNEWGFDGFKGDYVWGMPKCYDESHGHAYPEESTENQSELYRTAWEAMVNNDPGVFNLLCNCGTPQDFYSLPYVTQVATADPTSLDQTRRRVKAYKAIMGDDFPITTDHNEIWYPSAVGTGSVLIEKRAFSGADQVEYEKWLSIANREQLHKGTFVGDLYCYGYDPYETYVVEKDGVMYYAFYRDGAKYRPEGNPDIELKGLDPDKMYRIVDYVNDRVVATNLQGDDAIFSCRFSAYLLLKAIEISEPDPEPVDPDWGFTSVDAMDVNLVYTGNWHDDYNDSFYNGTARYTPAEGSSVEFTFAGTAIRWYGQRDTNFGTAAVYLDDELVGTVSANGNAESEVLLFEALDLPAAIHKIKIVCQTPVIDIDRFAYEAAIPELVYEKVDALSDRITYGGTWAEVHDEAFYMGNTVRTTEAGAYAEMTFTGTAIRWYGTTSLRNYGAADVY
ncbi:MAG: alpha-galactosidase, partial [Oscillospiraceae bacterium]|nr:alpha-galactosidase [Oscillospiraceae bacterium]